MGGRSTQKQVKMHNRYLNILNLFNISMILLNVLFDDFDYMLLSSLLNCMLRINVHSCSLDNCWTGHVNTLKSKFNGTHVWSISYCILPTAMPCLVLKFHKMQFLLIVKKPMQFYEVKMWPFNLLLIVQIEMIRFFMKFPFAFGKFIDRIW